MVAKGLGKALRNEEEFRENPDPATVSSHRGKADKRHMGACRMGLKENLICK